MDTTLTQEVYDLITSSKMKSGNNWGCGVIISDPATGKLLMGERTDTHNMCTPGGKVEPGETVLNGITRECLEECGLKLRSVKFMGYRVHTSPNGKNWVSYMFWSNDFEGTPKPQLSEIVSWDWYDPITVGGMDIFPATDASLQVACKLGLMNPIDNTMGVQTELINGDGNGDTDVGDGYVNVGNGYMEQELESELQPVPALFGVDCIPDTCDLYHHGRCDEHCSYSYAEDGGYWPFD